MLSNRKLDEITRNLSKGKRRASNLGTIYGIYNNFVDIRMGNSPTLLKNVPVQGDSDTLFVGQKVRVEWAEKEGTPGEAPFISGGAGDFISGQGGSSTVTVDNVTITKGFVGLSVKKAGIGTQHLNFLPAMDGHTHESKLELGGWEFTDDGIMYTDYMYIHPLGMIKVGGGFTTEDDVIVIDSNDATYRLWAGDQVAASAPFSVSKAGAIKATSGEIGGWTISSTEIAGGGIEMSSSGYIQSNPFTSGLIGFRIDDNVAEFNNVRVRGEIHAAVFVYDEIHALSGAFGVFYSAGVLLNDVTTLSSPSLFNVDIKDPDTGHAQLFEANDILRIKDGSGSDNWMHVDTVSNQGTFFRYGCELESGTPTTFRAGAAVVDYGLSGQGFIMMTAYDGTSGSDANLTMATHSGSPWSGQDIQLRLGNLNGSYDFSTDVYGIGIGDISGNYMKYDSTSGQLVISGSVVIGNGVGFITDALIQCSFDGPRPFASNFAVDTTGHLGQVGAQFGGLRGEAGKFHKSVVPAAAATNLVGNPVAHTGTGWWGTVSAGTTRSTDFAKYGTACYKIVDDTTSWVFLLTPNLTVTASTQYTGSFWFHDGDGNWVRRIDTVTTQVGATWMNFGVFRNEANHDLYVRYYSNIGTILETGVDLGVAATAFYVDGFQLEQAADETPFFHGSMGPGFSWVSTAHASSSSRVKSYITYPTNENFNREQGSISCWVYYPGHHTNDYPRIFHYYESGTDQLVLLFQNTGNTAYAVMSSGGTNKYVYSTALVTGWNNLIITWVDGGDFKFYTNSALTGTQTSNTPVGTKSGTFYVGSDHNGNTNLNTYLDDLVILDRVLSQDEIDQIYYSDLPVNVSTRHFGLLMSEPDKGMIIGNAEGIYGYDVDGDLGFSLTNDGEILAGGGDVKLDKWGIEIEATGTGSETTKQIEFKYGAYQLGYIEAYYSVASSHYFAIQAKDYDGRDTNLVLDADAGIYAQSGDSHYFRVSNANGMCSFGALNTSWFHIDTNRPGVYFYDPVNFALGIRVGDSTLASNDDIRAAADIVAGGSLSAGNVNYNPSVGGKVYYTANLVSVQTASHNVYAFHPLPISSYAVSFFGGNKGNTGGALYYVDNQFTTVPRDAVAIAVSCSGKDVVVGADLVMGPSATYKWQFELYTQVANNTVANSGVLPLDALGRFYLQTNQMWDWMYMRCVGYWV